MSYLVLSCSLNPESKSWLLAESVNQSLGELSDQVEFLDLAQEKVPFCDGGEAYSDPTAIRLVESISSADGIVLCAPIYNFDVNAAAKNLIELTGRNWTDKIVGFACAAGGQGSYMSMMSVANSLMLDFRCHIVPRFVYALGSAFQGESITDPDILDRTKELAHEMFRVTEALKAEV